MIPLFRCDEIYREFTGSDLKKKNSNNERRVVVLTSLDRVGNDEEEKRVRQELSELDIMLLSCCLHCIPSGFNITYIQHVWSVGPATCTLHLSSRHGQGHTQEGLFSTF